MKYIYHIIYNITILSFTIAEFEFLKLTLNIFVWIET